jgi:hypothetical protein
MTPERFELLTEAYGSDLRRWPVTEQEAAQALCQSHPVWTRALLDQASDLDDQLDRYRIDAPSAALRERVLAMAPVPHLSPWRRLSEDWRGWGVGLVAAGVAGLMVGIGSMSLMMTDLTTDSTVASTLDGQSVYSEALAFGAEDTL